MLSHKHENGDDYDVMGFSFKFCCRRDTYSYHIEIKVGHHYRVVTHTSTWSYMRRWHRPTLNSQIELHHGIYIFTYRLMNMRP